MMTNIIWISISSGSVFHFKQVTLLTCRQLCTTVSSSNEHYSKITEWCETTSVTLVLWLLRRKALSCSGRKLSGGVYNIPTGVHLTHHIQESGLWLLVVCWRMRREEQRNGRVSPLVFCFLLSLSLSLCVSLLIRSRPEPPICVHSLKKPGFDLPQQSTLLFKI